MAWWLSEPAISAVTLLTVDAGHSLELSFQSAVVYQN